MLSPVRPCLSVTRADQSKTVEVRIIKFSPYGSPIPLVFVGKFQLEILRGSSQAGRQIREGRKISHFLALNVNISKTAGLKLLLMTNRKSHMSFQ